MSTALRFSASSSPPPPATDPITHPLGSLPTVDVPERHMIVGHSCHISHWVSPACDAPRRVHSFVTCVGCAMLRARLRHLHASGLLQAGCMPVSPACAAPRCVHSFVTRGCCAMSRASLRHLCVSRHAACIPAPPVRARPGKKKEKKKIRS